MNSADCVNKIVEKLFNDEVSDTTLLNKKSWKRIEKTTHGSITKRVFEHRESGYKAIVDESDNNIINITIHKDGFLFDAHADESDEDKVYKSKELYFALVDHEDEDHGDGLTIYITPINFWNREKCLADFIGGHNVDNDALVNGGCYPVENAESIFSPADDDITIDELKASMINAGFVYSKDMEEYLSN